MSLSAESDFKDTGFLREARLGEEAERANKSVEARPLFRSEQGAKRPDHRKEERVIGASALLELSLQEA